MQVQQPLEIGVDMVACPTFYDPVTSLKQVRLDVLYLVWYAD